MSEPVAELGGLPNARAVLGSMATLERVFGLATLGDEQVAARWTSLCDEAGVDPILGPTEAPEEAVAAFVEALPSLRKRAKKRAKRPADRAVALLLNLCAYDDPASLSPEEKLNAEYLRVGGKGRPRWSPDEFPRVRVLELHDNGLDEAFFEDFSLEGFSQLLVVTLHGNRVKKVPPLPESVKYVSIASAALTLRKNTSVVTDTPEGQAKLAGQMLQGAAVGHLMCTMFAVIWGLSLTVYSFGICCVFLALPVLPVMAAINDLMLGSALASGQRAGAAADRVGLSFTLSVLMLVGFNFGALIFPLVFIPIVLEFMAVSKLGRKDVKAWLSGQSDGGGDDKAVRKELADSGVDDL